MPSLLIEWSPLAYGVAAAFLGAIYLLYQAALPKPLPGIPYNRYAARRILGDLPEAIPSIEEHESPDAFWREQLVKMQSPVIQLFLRPFSSPFVILADFREAQDIMVRRTREFDRSSFFGDLFSTLAPHQQASMPTNGEWKANRRLTADIMSPQFIDSVSGPQVYEKALDMIQLWKMKAKLAQGRPFNIIDDMTRGGMDAIWTTTFGTDIGVTKGQIQGVYQSLS